MFKIIKRYILTIVIILGIILFALVVKAVNDSYRINKTISSIINEQGSCKSVTNNSVTNDYFIPTKTLIEWNLFKQNKPSDVSLSSCYQCLENGQIYSDSSSCISACTQTASCTENVSYSYYHNSQIGSSNGCLADCSGACVYGSYGTGAELIGIGREWQNCPQAEGDYTVWFYRTPSYSYSCPLSGGSACSENTLYNTNGPYISCVSGSCPSGQGGNSACTCQTNRFQTLNTCTYNSYASGGNNYFDCVYTATLSTVGSPSICTAGQSCTTLP